MTTHDRTAPRASGTELSRRSFLATGAAAGGGLMLSLSLPFGQSEAAASEAFAPNAFIRIGSDGQVVLTMPYVEMGQGTYTSIPMLIAEELDLSLKQVKLEHAPANERLYANPLLGVQATGNSNAMRGAWKPLRRVHRLRHPWPPRPRQSRQRHARSKQHRPLLPHLRPWRASSRWRRCRPRLR